MRSGWIVAAVWGSGCVLESAPLAPGFEEELTEQGGCGDLVAFAVDAEDQVLLTVRLDGPIAAAGGESFTVDLALPDPSAEVKVELGSRISDAICDDVIENGGPQVRETWTAVSGTLAGEVTVEEPSTLADLTLEEVVFESPSGDQVTVEVLSWTALSVGWLPG